jgi:hypothetical protein
VNITVPTNSKNDITDLSGSIHDALLGAVMANPDSGSLTFNWFLVETGTSCNVEPGGVYALNPTSTVEILPVSDPVSPSSRFIEPLYYINLATEKVPDSAMV